MSAHVYVPVWVHARMCVPVHVHVHVSVCVGPRLTSGIFLDLLYLIRWGKVFQPTQSRLLQPVWVGSLLEKFPVFFPHPGVASWSPGSQSLYVSPGNLNSCSHTCASSILPTKHLPVVPTEPCPLWMGCASWRHCPWHSEISYPQRHSKPIGIPRYYPRETPGRLRMSSKVRVLGQTSLSCLFSQDFPRPRIPFQKSAECALLFKTRIYSLEFATYYFGVYSRSNLGSV